MDIREPRPLTQRAAQDSCTMKAVIVSHVATKETGAVELSAAHAPATTQTRLMAEGVEITVTVVVVIVIVVIASDVGVATRANCAADVGTVLAATAVVAIVEGATAVVATAVGQIVQYYETCVKEFNLNKLANSFQKRRKPACSKYREYSKKNFGFRNKKYVG